MLNALLTLGGLQLLTMLVFLLRTKTLAIMLGPDGIGLLGIVDKLLATVAQTVSLSLPFAAVRFLPELWNRSQDEFVALTRRMRNLLLLLALIATGFGLAATTFSPQLWGKELLPYENIVFVGFLTLPVLVFVPFVQNVIAGRMAHNLSALFGLGHAAILALAGIAGAALGGLRTLYSLYAVLGLMLVVLGTKSAAFASPAPKQRRTERSFAMDLPRRIWNFSFALWSLAFVMPFAALYVHYHVLRVFGIEVAGWMQAAMGVGLAVRSLLGSAHPFFLTPNVNRGGSKEERMQWANEFQKTFSFLCIVTVLPLLLFPHIVVMLLYSPEFLPAASFVALFVIGEILTLLAGTYQALIVAFDHLVFHVAQNLIAQGVLVIVASSLIQSYGILGAGVAAICAQLILYSGSTLYLHWRHGLKIPVRSGLATLYVVTSLGLAGLAGALYSELSWGIVLGKIFLYAFSIASLGFFVTAADWGKFYTFTKSVQTRLHLPLGLGRS